MEASQDLTLARLDELTQAVADLKRRVAQLEGHPEPDSASEPLPDLPSLALPADVGEAGLAWADSLVPLFGWGLLGIAGAYLLRAVTEAGYLPGTLGAGVGIIYAAWWLFLAAHRATERPMFSIIHGLTAALIMAPMLWEMTVKFHLLSGQISSAVAVCFTVFGLAIGWRRNLTAIAWIATLAGLLTATALFRETHDVTVWALTILVIAAATEFSACRDHWLGLRWIVAIVADIAILMVTLLAMRPPDAAQVVAAPAMGVVLGLQIALLTIYLSSTIDRTLFRHLNITGFEIGQAAMAFVISIGGALQVTRAGQAGAVSVGLFCLLGGAACYLVSFASLDHQDGRSRNFYTYSTFAVLLVVAGFDVLLKGGALAGAWSALAVAMLLAGLLRNRNTLRVHACVYLFLAVAASRMLQLATERIIRTNGDPLSALSAAYLLALAGAAICYAIIVVRQGKALDAVVAASLVCWGLLGLAAGWMDAAPLRTAMLTALAITAGWAGSRWSRRELLWLAYPLMALAGLKLMLEDFQLGRSLTLFASLIFFGGGLILLPRLVKHRRTAA
ncbi:MAG TPA: hypothetical protein VGK29_19485 [Paludibaculum sp.]|jgi:hypothetical protein